MGGVLLGLMNEWRVGAGGGLVKKVLVTRIIHDYVDKYRLITICFLFFFYKIQKKEQEKMK